MTDEAAADDEAFPTEADINAVLAEFDGDHRSAIGALLHDMVALAADYELSISRGFVGRSTTLTIGLQSRARGAGDR